MSYYSDFLKEEQEMDEEKFDYSVKTDYDLDFLKKAKKKHKKSSDNKSALGYFTTLNAGNVPVQNAFFNMSMGNTPPSCSGAMADGGCGLVASAGSASNGGTGMGEELENKEKRGIKKMDSKRKERSLTADESSAWMDKFLDEPEILTDKAVETEPYTPEDDIIFVDDMYSGIYDEDPTEFDYEYETPISGFDIHVEDETTQPCPYTMVASKKAYGLDGKPINVGLFNCNDDGCLCVTCHPQKVCTPDETDDCMKFDYEDDAYNCYNGYEDLYDEDEFMPSFGITKINASKDVISPYDDNYRKSMRGIKVDDSVDDFFVTEGLDKDEDGKDPEDKEEKEELLLEEPTDTDRLPSLDNKRYLNLKDLEAIGNSYAFIAMESPTDKIVLSKPITKMQRAIFAKYPFIKVVSDRRIDITYPKDFKQYATENYHMHYGKRLREEKEETGEIEFTANILDDDGNVAGEETITIIPSEVEYLVDVGDDTTDIHFVDGSWRNIKDKFKSVLKTLDGIDSKTLMEWEVVNVTSEDLLSDPFHVAVDPEEVEDVSESDDYKTIIEIGGCKFLIAINVDDYNAEVEKATADKDELTEDTVKKKNGKWTNKGKDGEHGEFKTKKEADAQRKAMFANGYHESRNHVSHGRRLREAIDEDPITEITKISVGKWKDADVINGVAYHPAQLDKDHTEMGFYDVDSQQMIAIYYSADNYLEYYAKDIKNYDKKKSTIEKILKDKRLRVEGYSLRHGNKRLNEEAIETILRNPRDIGLMYHDVKSSRSSDGKTVKTTYKLCRPITDEKERELRRYDNVGYNRRIRIGDMYRQTMKDNPNSYYDEVTIVTPYEEQYKRKSTRRYR